MGIHSAPNPTKPLIYFLHLSAIPVSINAINKIDLRVNPSPKSIQVQLTLYKQNP